MNKNCALNLEIQNDISPRTFIFFALESNRHKKERKKKTQKKYTKKAKRERWEAKMKKESLALESILHSNQSVRFFPD